MSVKTNYRKSAKVRRITAKVTDVDADAVALFDLPGHSWVLGFSIAVTDAFNTGATLKVGTAANDDQFLTAQAIDVLGTFNPVSLAGTLHTDTDTVITATISDKSATGECYVSMLFSMDRDTVL